jgi:hypothetical protein
MGTAIRISPPPTSSMASCPGIGSRDGEQPAARRQMNNIARRMGAALPRQHAVSVDRNSESLAQGTAVACSLTAIGVRFHAHHPSVARVWSLEAAAILDPGGYDGPARAHVACGSIGLPSIAGAWPAKPRLAALGIVPGNLGPILVTAQNFSTDKGSRLFGVHSRWCVASTNRSGEKRVSRLIRNARA